MLIKLAKCQLQFDFLMILALKFGADMKKVFTLCFFLVFSAGAGAGAGAGVWTFGNNVSISAVVLWENAEETPSYFQRFDNVWCYVPAGQKNFTLWF